MAGRLFDLAMALSVLDWRRGLDVLAGTLLFWGMVLTLLAGAIEALPWLLELLYWMLYSM
jgi:hypothetical protein